MAVKEAAKKKQRKRAKATTEEPRVLKEEKAQAVQREKRTRRITIKIG